MDAYWYNIGKVLGMMLEDIVGRLVAPEFFPEILASLSTIPQRITPKQQFREFLQQEFGHVIHLQGSKWEQIDIQIICHFYIHVGWLRGVYIHSIYVVQN